MKALVYHGPRQLRWQDWPTPVAGPYEAVVAVRAVGICGSDIHGYTGESGRRTPPMVMGHEFTGEVIDVGPDGSDWTGQSVIVRPFLHCGLCPQCHAGSFNLCRNRRFLGANADGGMAERVKVPIGNLLPLDPRISFTQGALTEPLAVGIHASHVAGDIKNKRVLIVGGGAIGLLTLVAVREAGAAEIVLLDPVEDRRHAATALGATHAAGPDDDFGDGYDVAFDAVGLAPTMERALNAVAPGAIAVALGGWKTVPLNLVRLVSNETILRGSFNFTPNEFLQASQWLAEGRIETTKLANDRRPLSDGASVFEDIVDKRIGGVKITLVHEG